MTVKVVAVVVPTDGAVRDRRCSRRLRCRRSTRVQPSETASACCAVTVRLPGAVGAPGSRSRAAGHVGLNLGGAERAVVDPNARR